LGISVVGLGIAPVAIELEPRKILLTNTALRVKIDRL
jgi:hypothetical protein